MNRRQWYERTNAEWPAVVPVPTPEEAIRGARKLWRFVRGRKCTLPVVLTSGNRSTWVSRGVLRVNPDCQDGHGGGWKSLVHDLGHYLGGKHGKAHARFEARMIRVVVKRGWLTGALKPTPAPAPTPAVDARAVRAERIAARLDRWEAKERRARNAIKKLRRQYARMARGVGAVHAGA